MRLTHDLSEMIADTDEADSLHPGNALAILVRWRDSIVMLESPMIAISAFAAHMVHRRAARRSSPTLIFTPVPLNAGRNFPADSGVRPFCRPDLLLEKADVLETPFGSEIGRFQEVIIMVPMFRNDAAVCNDGFEIVESSHVRHNGGPLVCLRLFCVVFQRALQSSQQRLRTRQLLNEHHQDPPCRKPNLRMNEDLCVGLLSGGRVEILG